MLFALLANSRWSRRSDREGLNADPRNERTRIARFGHPRGDILTYDGTTIASQPDDGRRAVRVSPRLPRRRAVRPRDRDGLAQPDHGHRAGRGRRAVRRRPEDPGPLAGQARQGPRAPTSGSRSASARSGPRTRASRRRAGRAPRSPSTRRPARSSPWPATRRTTRTPTPPPTPPSWPRRTGGCAATPPGRCSTGRSTGAIRRAPRSSWSPRPPRCRRASPLALNRPATRMIGTAGTTGEARKTRTAGTIGETRKARAAEDGQDGPEGRHGRAVGRPIRRCRTPSGPPATRLRRHRPPARAGHPARPGGGVRLQRPRPDGSRCRSPPAPIP